MQHWNNENYYEIVSPCTRFVAALRWNGPAVELLSVRAVEVMTGEEIAQRIKKHLDTEDENVASSSAG